MQIIQFLKDCKDYEWICKRRNNHKPNSVDLEEFLKNKKIPKDTFCEDCRFPLELLEDKEDEQSYWVNEI
jgi:hypothetical protein